MRFDLGSDQIPSAWYNALPDLPEPMQPPLHPATKEPVGPDDLARRGRHPVLGEVLINVPVKTYTDVSQFWTWKPEEFLKQGPYKR
jgi:predicted alternative tryptophan synthase beta-subunit